MITQIKVFEAVYSSDLEGMTNEWLALNERTIAVVSINTVIQKNQNPGRKLIVTVTYTVRSLGDVIATTYVPPTQAE